MEFIVPRDKKRVFSIEEARQLLPVIYRITEDSHKEVKSLLNKIEALKGSNRERVLELEEQVASIVDRWNAKLERLGAKPKGVWLADFDKGDGYYCWKFPETNISHFHGYDEGFTGRKLI
jgi:hypothetical protein